MRQRAEHDKKIDQIVADNKHEWSTLYNHPKLMNMYYWKDDQNNSR